MPSLSAHSPKPFHPKLLQVLDVDFSSVFPPQTSQQQHQQQQQSTNSIIASKVDGEAQQTSSPENNAVRPFSYLFECDCPTPSSSIAVPTESIDPAPILDIRGLPGTELVVTSARLGKADVTTAIRARLIQGEGKELRVVLTPSIVAELLKGSKMAEGEGNGVEGSGGLRLTVVCEGAEKKHLPLQIPTSSGLLPVLDLTRSSLPLGPCLLPGFVSDGHRLYFVSAQSTEDNPNDEEEVEEEAEEDDEDDDEDLGDAEDTLILDEGVEAVLEGLSGEEKGEIGQGPRNLLCLSRDLKLSAHYASARLPDFAHGTGNVFTKFQVNLSLLPPIVF